MTGGPSGKRRVGRRPPEMYVTIVRSGVLRKPPRRQTQALNLLRHHTGPSGDVATGAVSDTTTRSGRNSLIQDHPMSRRAAESTDFQGSVESEREILRWILTQRGVTLS